MSRGSTTRRLRIVLGVALGCVLLLIAVSTAMSRSAKRRQMEQWRALGFPTSMEEWQTAYDAHTPEDNRASTLRDAAAAHNASASRQLPTYERKAPRGTEFEEATWVSIRDHLQSNQETRSLIDQALENPEFLFPLDFSQGFNLLLPHISEIRTLVRLLLVEALHHAHEGRMDAAATSLQDAIVISQALDHEDILISHLVRIANEIQIIDTFERVLSLGSLPDPTLKTFQDHWATRYDPNALARSHAMELSFGKEYFKGGFPMFLQNVGNPTPQGSLAAVPLDILLRISGLHAADEAFYQRTLIAWIEAAQLTGEKRIDAGRAIDTEVTQKLKQSFMGRFRNLMSGMLLPALSRSLTKDHTYLAIVRTAEVGCAIERYRLAHDGKLPPNLEALVPEFIAAIPDDPWDDKPLRYQALEDGTSYTVYSIGEARVDKGGLPPALISDPRISPPREVFWVQRPLLSRPD